jgi:hypothetical protein
VFRMIFSFIIFFPLCQFAWYLFTSPFGYKSPLKIYINEDLEGAQFEFRSNHVLNPLVMLNLLEWLILLGGIFFIDTCIPSF